MRHSVSQYLRPAASLQAVVLLAVLTPTIWLWWQAPALRGIALPALGILSLLLLAVQGLKTAHDSESRVQDAVKGRSHPEPRTLSRALSLSRGPVLPAVLYVCWVGILAGRDAANPAPGVADFARGEFLRILGAVAVGLAIAGTMHRWDGARRVVNALLLAVVLGTLVAMATQTAEETSLRGAFGNRQLFAAFLLLLAPLAVAFSTATPNLPRRILAQVATVLALGILLLLQTRSAWVGGIVALGVLAGLLHLLPRRRGRRRDLRPALAAAGLALGGLGWLVCKTDFSGSVLARMATLGHLSDDAGMAWRLRQWRVAASLAREQPLVGHGPGRFALAAAPRLPRPIPLDLVLSTGPNLSLNAHSYYLQTLVETGAIGLGLYLWAISAFLLSGWRALYQASGSDGRRRSGLREALSGQRNVRTHGSLNRASRVEERYRFLVLAACMSAVCGAAVDALANPAYQFADVSQFLWIILGLGTAMTRQGVAGGRRHRKESTRSTPDPHSLPRGPAVPSPHGSLLRVAVAFGVTGILVVGGVAGETLPVSSPEYMPFDSLRVVGHTTPGYLRATILPGECVEFRATGVRERVGEQDLTAQCRFSRAGGTAPRRALEQLAPPHGNLFCLPTGVTADLDGQTVQFQATFEMNGHSLTGLAQELMLSVPRACPGATVTAMPRVLPPTGEQIQVRLQTTNAGCRFQRLQRVECNEPLARDDIQIVDNTHLILRAVSTVPGRRIYTAYCRFADRHGRAWVAPVQIYVR